MHPAISRSYVVPAIVLNPVLFLMILNTILAHTLPPIVIDSATQPTQRSSFGFSVEHPHLDIHASENLCWGYTALIVFVQLAAYRRVGIRREEKRERARVKTRLDQEKYNRKSDQKAKAVQSYTTLRDAMATGETRGTGQRKLGGWGTDNGQSFPTEASSCEFGDTSGSDLML